jgi:long-chain fatty acid transport protein
MNEIVETKMWVNVRSSRNTVLAMLAGLWATSPAMAGGLYITEFGTPVEGSASAGSNALAEDASIGFHNAAGIVFLEEEGGYWLASVGGLNVAAEFKSEPGTVVPGNDGGDAGGFSPVASLFYSRKVSDKWGWGVSLLSVSAAILEYDDDWVGRYWAEEVTLFTINVTPAVSYRINDRWSVGLSVPIMFGALEMDLAVPVGPPEAPIAEGSVNIDGNDIGATWSLSTFIDVSPRTNVGFIYVAENEVSLESDITVDPVGLVLDADVEFPFVQTARLSIAHDISDNVTLLGTFAWEDWSSFENLLVSTTMGDQAIARNWEDTYKYALGVRWRSGDSWTWHTGAAYDTSPTNASERTPDMPIDRQIRLGFGGQYERPSGKKIGMVFEYVDMGDGRIENDLLVGEYETNRFVTLSVNVAW